MNRIEQITTELKSVCALPQDTCTPYPRENIRYLIGEVNELRAQLAECQHLKQEYIGLSDRYSDTLRECRISKEAVTKERDAALERVASLERISGDCFESNAYLRQRCKRLEGALEEIVPYLQDGARISHIANSRSAELHAKARAALAPVDYKASMEEWIKDGGITD